MITGRDIFNCALAHCYEQDRDALTKDLSVALINVGLSELTEAENKFRKHQALAEGTEYLKLREPVFINELDDPVDYCYQVTTTLLPLWLAWKVFEGMDDNRADSYRMLYERKFAEIVPHPAEWETPKFDAWGNCYEA